MLRERGHTVTCVARAAATSARRVADVAVDALERGSDHDIPVADENLTWSEMISRIAAAAGRPRRTVRLPSVAVRASLGLAGALQALSGRESGTDLRRLPDLLLADLFIEPVSGQPLDRAIEETFGA